jgi:5,10-methylenetetrahydromethanopterin reductase
MEFGIVIPTWADCSELVAKAERLGFSHAWFYDTQLLNADVFVGMATAAMATKKIRLGTGVLIPSNRIAPVAAAAFATLNKLAPGRIDCGIGTGFTGRRTMGLKAITHKALADYIRIMQGLWGRETIEWEFENETRKIRFLNPELDLTNTSDPIGMHVSALGPKTRRLTADLNAGWINFPNFQAAALGDLEDMKRSWLNAGHDAGDLHATAFACGCVLADGEAADSARAKAQAGPSAAVMLHAIVENEANGAPPARLPDHIRDLIDRYHGLYKTYAPEDAKYLELHRGHLMFLRPDEEALVTGDLIRDATHTATKSDLVERIQELKRAGYNQFSVQITPGQEDAIDDWAAVFDAV